MTAFSLTPTSPASRRPTATPWLVIAVTLALLLAGSAAAQAAGASFHVEIDDGDDHITLQLPLSLVQAAAVMMPSEIEIDGHLQIDDADLEIEDLRALWQIARDSPETRLFELETRDGEEVTIFKDRGMLRIETRERDATIDTEIPIAVIDALFDAPRGHLDLAGALAALAAEAGSPRMTIRDGDDLVRIWVEPGDEAR